MATKYQDKNNYWYVRYKDESGEWKSKYCGKKATATDAETIRKNYDAKELNHKHKTLVRLVKSNLMVQLEEFKEKEIPKSKTGIPKSKKSTQRYQSIVKNFVEFCELKGVKNYEDATEKVIDQFFDSLYDLKRSASTVEKHIQILRNFFDWSIKNHFISENPAKNVTNPKRKKSIPRYYSEDELKQIFGRAENQYKNIFQFLYLTGMREGELCNMEWSHIIEHTQTLLIPILEGNKTKRECSIPLNSDAMRIIELQKELNKEYCTFDAKRFVFVNYDGLQLDGANVYRNLMVILKHCKITNAKVHTFRHTCASHLVIKGVSLYMVKEILRHASITETEIYAHLSKEAVRTAIDKLSLSLL